MRRKQITTRKFWVYLLRFAIGFGLLGVLIYSIGISALLGSLRQIRTFWAVSTAMCLAGLFVLGAFNVWIPLRTMCPFPFNEFIRSYLYCFAVNLVAPGQLGDASLTIFLKRQGVPVRFSSVAYILDKTITVFVLFFVAFYGASLFLPQIDHIWFLILPVVGITMGLVLINVLLRVPFRFQYARLLQKWVALAIGECRIFRTRWYFILLNIFLTFVKWLILSLCYFVAFLSFDTRVSWPAIGLIPVLSTLVGYIPISIGGIGTSEYAAVYLFSLEGLRKVTVLNTYILLRFMQYLITFGLFLFFTRFKGSGIGLSSCVDCKTLEMDGKHCNHISSLCGG